MHFKCDAGSNEKSCSLISLEVNRRSNWNANHSNGNEQMDFLIGSGD